MLLSVSEVPMEASRSGSAAQPRLRDELRDGRVWVFIVATIAFTSGSFTGWNLGVANALRAMAMASILVSVVVGVAIRNRSSDGMPSRAALHVTFTLPALLGAVVGSFVA